MKIIVLDGAPLNSGDLSWDALNQLGEVTIHERTAPAQVADRIAGAQAVLTNKVKLTAEHFAGAPDLKYVGEMATGFDNIDVQAARENGITVSNVPSYSANFTAQTAIALLLELCHHVGSHADAVAAGDWASSPDFSFWNTPLIDLEGKNLVILGMGTIGRRVAVIGDALGMRVIAAQSPGRDYDADSMHIPLADALPQADVLSLHCPLKPETRGLVNAEFLGQMKSSALLINTARGAIINEADLAAALEQGTIAGFAGDVLSVEPPSASNPLIGAKTRSSRRISAGLRPRRARVACKPGLIIYGRLWMASRVMWCRRLWSPAKNEFSTSSFWCVARLVICRT